VCNEGAENERFRVSRVGEHSCTPLFVYRLLLEATTQCFRLSAISAFFSKKVAQVAIVGNKTEPKITINSDKLEKKIIHNNLLRSLKKKHNLPNINKTKHPKQGREKGTRWKDPSPSKWKISQIAFLKCYGKSPK